MAAASTATRYVMKLYPDEDEKKRLEKKRRKQRQSHGYPAKRKNLGKKPTEVALDDLDSWESYLRAMLIAAYLKVEEEWEDVDEKKEALNTILCCCPVDRELQVKTLVNRKITKILDEEFAPICDLARRSMDGDKIEPALFLKATEMLHKLRDFFPTKMKVLAGSPYDGRASNVCGEALDNLLAQMKHAAKFRHLGATVDEKDEKDEKEK
ncbi:hypothetical protein SELMODRAFT_416758 [Selaginella moellendorffii]|uniref:Uncharacterized protein n=1 Tax=Selaginella moellendorffii TaxID=88036 RepID=D8S0B7_SELML|nr:hypothetical protein SELMODRAFT_416758 [Selaginella moellendorffii]